MKKTKILVAILILGAALLPGTASGAELGPLPESDDAHINAPKAIPFDLAALKKNWRERIAAIKAKGMLPIIDIESSFNSKRLNLRRLAQAMDEMGVALIAFPTMRTTLVGRIWPRVVSVDPWRFIPTTNGGVHPNNVYFLLPSRNLDERLTFQLKIVSREPLIASFLRNMLKK